MPPHTLPSKRSPKFTPYSKGGVGRARSGRVKTVDEVVTEQQWADYAYGRRSKKPDAVLRREEQERQGVQKLMTLIKNLGQHTKRA